MNRHVEASASEGRVLYSKLSSKGQITIPAEVRASMGLQAGDRIAFEALRDGRFRVTRAEDSFETLRGIVRADRPVTHDGVARALAEARAAMGRPDAERP